MQGFQRQAVGTGTRLRFKSPSTFACQAGINNFATISYTRLQLKLGQNSSRIREGGGDIFHSGYSVTKARV
jgi:hypothetical protein